MMDEHDVFAAVGGHDAFTALIDTFYDTVANDPVLRPMYPDDLAPGKAHLALFFAQYFGAPNGPYSTVRGHPRLRQRHVPYPINQDAALRWANAMHHAISAQPWPDDAADTVHAYVNRATPMLINMLG